jgi:hypothetical protein
VALLGANGSPLQNLWLCNQGGPGCANKPSGVEEVNLVLTIDRPITSLSPKGEPQSIGSFEFEVRYDAKLVTVVIEPGALFAVRPEVDCASIQGEAFVRFRCVTKGKPGDTPVGPGTLAVVRVRATTDVYSMLIPSQENGIASQLINQDCNVNDLQGHPIKTAGCNDAAVTIRYLEGDVHADCVVDIHDQQQIAFRWGSNEGQLLYNSRYDLEPSAPPLGDGDIDVKDLQTVFGRHGSTCKVPHPPQPPIDPKAKVEPPG